jgi:uncharacterized protein
MSGGRQPGLRNFLGTRRRHGGSPIAALTDFSLLRLRHGDAWKLDQDAGDVGEGFESLRGHKYCLLITFRNNGEALPTPVWFGLADGKVYLESEAAAGKVRRIQRNRRVRLAPCTLRGKPLGPALEGCARILGPEESEPAERAIADHYGLFRKLFDGSGKRLGVQSVKIEVSTPQSAT